MRKERHNHLTSGVTVLKFHLPAANERREYAEIFHIVLTKGNCMCTTRWRGFAAHERAGQRTNGR